MQSFLKSSSAVRSQRDPAQSPTSPYLRPAVKEVEEDLESNDSSASNLSFATSASSVAETMSSASYATAKSKSSYWSRSEGMDSPLPVEMQARALANDPDSIIEALTRCEVLAGTNLPRAIKIAKEIMESCIELLTDTHVFIMPIRATLGALYIKAEQFQLAETELRAALSTWLDNQSDENQGVEQILFPLGKHGRFAHRLIGASCLFFDAYLLI